jgi:hypothetical protein
MAMATNGPVDYNALVRESRVHSRVYIDQQIFEDEMERIFHRGWVFVGHASEIPEPGDYRRAWVGRYPIIMVRGAALVEPLPPSGEHSLPERARECAVFPLRLSRLDVPQ